MNRTNHSFTDWNQLARVLVLLAGSTLAGCGSSDTVITPPEGGPAPVGSDTAKPSGPKPAKNLSSRREREKQVAQ